MCLRASRIRNSEYLGFAHEYSIEKIALILHPLTVSLTGIHVREGLVRKPQLSCNAYFQPADAAGLLRRISLTNKDYVCGILIEVPKEGKQIAGGLAAFVKNRGGRVLLEK